MEHLHGKLKGSGVELSYILVNPLSLNSEPHTISPNNNTACLNRQVMRMNEMIMINIVMLEQILSSSTIRNV